MSRSGRDIEPWDTDRPKQQARDAEPLPHRQVLVDKLCDVEQLKQRLAIAEREGMKARLEASAKALARLHSGGSLSHSHAFTAECGGSLLAPTGLRDSEDLRRGEHPLQTGLYQIEATARVADEENMSDSHNLTIEIARLKECLHEIAFFQYRVDGRIHPQYENGWNDAVDAITEKARHILASEGINADTFMETRNAAQQLVHRARRER